MENLYLNIEKLGDDKIYIYAYDGIFVYSAPCISKENFQKYCDEKADMWLNSTLDNFHGWSKQKEKALHINGLLLKIYLKEDIITILTLEIKKIYSVKKLLIQQRVWVLKIIH